MAQTMVSFRMDAGSKRDMETTCKKMGLSMRPRYTEAA